MIDPPQAASVSDMRRVHHSTCSPNTEPVARSLAKKRAGSRSSHRRPTQNESLAINDTGTCAVSAALPRARGPPERLCGNEECLGVGSSVEATPDGEWRIPWLLPSCTNVIVFPGRHALRVEPRRIVASKP